MKHTKESFFKSLDQEFKTQTKYKNYKDEIYFLQDKKEYYEKQKLLPNKDISVLNTFIEWIEEKIEDFYEDEADERDREYWNNGYYG